MNADGELSTRSDCLQCKSCRCPCSVRKVLVESLLRWRYHYPFFANSYVLAHHLAEGLNAEQANHSNSKVEVIKRINWHLRRHSGWPELPEFLGDTEFDILVGADDLGRKLRRNGHEFESVVFTRYRPQYFFIQRAPYETWSGKRASSSKASEKQAPIDWTAFGLWLRASIQRDPLIRIIVISDAPPTAATLRAAIQKLDPSHFPISRSPSGFDCKGVEIRNFTEREFGDTFDDNSLRVYVFGAPRTDVFYSRPERYIAVSLDDTWNVPTYVYVRHNHGLHQAAKTIADAVGSYFHLCFDLAKVGKKTAYKLPKWWDGRVARNYDRMAESARDVVLFQDMPTGRSNVSSERARRRFLEILDRHHYQPDPTRVPDYTLGRADE